MTERETRPVIVAGGGIAGLSLALTCHQIGVPVRVYESVRELAPLGVGINLQPNAVRELYDLGLADELPPVGLPAKEWALTGPDGREVWSEPRGLDAGYRWPQYAVHRGELQMMLYRTVLDRLGPDAVVTGRRVVGYRNAADGVTVTLDRRNGTTETVAGSLLVACDGIHSAVRAQMYPDQGPPQWGGAVMWRGTSYGPPIRTGSSFVLAGTMEQRFVHYPIGEVDAGTGLQLQNWITELTFDPTECPGMVTSDSSWNREVTIDLFLPEFESWVFEWLDVPAFIRGAGRVWEFPMVDRDPVDRWVDEGVALCGDAAHAMYPVGSNGASQAIVDTRVLGAKFVEHGVNPCALQAYDDALRGDVNALVLRNRGAGPVALLDVIAERCGGDFARADELVPMSERHEFMERYKAAAGFARDTLNAAGPTIAPDARVP